MERLTSFAGLVGGWHAGDNLERIRRTGNPYTTWTGRQAERHGYVNATRDSYEFLIGDHLATGTDDDQAGP